MPEDHFLGTGMKFPPQINPATGRFMVSSEEESVKDEKISAAINGDTLDIKKDNQVLHIFMFFCWYREEIVIEIPKDFSGDIKANASSGNIEVMDLEKMTMAKTGIEQF